MTRPVAVRCFNEMMMDMPLSPSVIVDFGIDSVEHHRALQMAVRAGATETDLDVVLGSGKKIMALVSRLVPKYSQLQYHTSYDDLEDYED